jgi:hypothetical protein
VTDITPPFTQATRTSGVGSVTIKLTATDNQGGSGVAQVLYWSTGAQVMGSAGSPVTVGGNTATVVINTSGTTTLFYHSVDNSGNVEATRSTQVRLP